MPSLFHSSVPVAGMVAIKNSVPSTLVRLEGEVPRAPGRMSLTHTVPAAVSPAPPVSPALLLVEREAVLMSRCLCRYTRGRARLSIRARAFYPA